MSEVVESVNPNNPVKSNLSKEGDIKADASGGPLTFDELEEVLSKGKRAKAEKKEEETEVESGKQAKSKDLSSDTDKGKKAEKKEAKSSDKDESKSDEPEKPARKTIKAKYQDSELDIDEEALVPVKINGKEEMVPVKELLGNYSGKVAWDKKFSEVDQTRKSVAAQQMKVKQIEDSIKSLLEEQDPEMKLYRMAKLAGVDEVEFRNKFYNDNISLLEKHYAMSEDERKAEASAYEAKVHKHRADTLEKSIKEEQDYKSLHSKVSELRERHQVSEQEFVDKYDQLEMAAKSGKFNKELMTPENIVKAIEVDRLWDAASKKLESLDLEWNGATKVQNLEKLVQQAHQIGLKPSDMAEIVDELWGVKKAQKKIESKKKENEEFISGKKEVPQMNKQSQDVWSFDQL